MICNSKNEFMNSLYSRLRTLNISEVEAKDILIDFEQHFTAGLEQGLSEQEVCTKLGDIEEIAKQYIEEEPQLATDAVQNAQADTVKNVQNLQAEPVSQTEQSTQCSQNVQPNSNENNFSTDNSGFDSSNNQQNNQSFQEQYAQNNQYNQGQYAQNNQYNQGQFAQNNQYNQGQFTENGQFNQTYQQQPVSKFSAGGLIGILCIDLFIFSWAIPSLFAIVISFCAAALSCMVGGFGIILESCFGGLSQFGAILVSPFVPVTNFFAGLIVFAIGGFLLMLAIVMVKGCVKLVRNIINLHSRMIVGRNVIAKKKKNFAA